MEEVSARISSETSLDREDVRANYERYHFARLIRLNRLARYGTSKNLLILSTWRIRGTHGSTNRSRKFSRKPVPRGYVARHYSSARINGRSDVLSARA